MLEHGLWAAGHRTVRTTRRRRDHTIEVLDDGVPLADIDGDGIVRAVDGLVLAEAPTFRGDPPPAPEERPVTRRPAATGGAGLWTDRPDEEERAAAAPTTAGSAGVGLVVDVFGVRQGEVRVVAAVERLRERSVTAELVVDGLVAGRMRTVGTRAEEAVVLAGDLELARLARFDHLRGVRRTVSSWDLDVLAVPDPRLRVLTVVALLRLPALRDAPARGHRSGRRRLARSG